MTLKHLANRANELVGGFPNTVRWLEFYGAVRMQYAERGRNRLRRESFLVGGLDARCEPVQDLAGGVVAVYAGYEGGYELANGRAFGSVWGYEQGAPLELVVGEDESALESDALGAPWRACPTPSSISA